MRGVCAILLWALLCVGAAVTVSAPAAAAEPAPAEGTVTRVSVKGTRWIEEAAVLANIGLRSGDELNADKVRRDLKAVWRSGFFQDIVVRTEPDGDGVAVIFEVVEKPAVTDVRFEGNKKVNEDDLRELMDARAFGVLNDAKVADLKRRIREKYVEKGFYLVQVDVDINKVGKNQVDVVYKITENRKVIIQRITFTGNDNIPDRKIRRFLQTKEGGPAPWLTNTGTFDRDILEIDQQRAMLPFLEEGFADVRIDPPKVYLSPDKRFIYVSFHVVEGPRYTIGNVRVVGDLVPEEGLGEDEVMQIIGGRSVIDIQEDQWRLANGKPPAKRVIVGRRTSVEPGDQYAYSAVGQVQEAIEALFKDRGYAFATVTPNPITNKEDRTVDLVYQVDKGDRMRIGRIHIQGNDPTIDKVVRREIEINEGELFNGSRIESSRFRIGRLGYFEPDVGRAIEPGQEPGTVDVTFKVAERPTGSFSLGLGYSSIERLALQGSIAKQNFLGLGFDLNAQVNWSALRRFASVSFFEPFLLDSRWTLMVNLFWQEQAFILNEYRRGGSLGIGRYLDPRNQLLLQVEYSVQDVGLNALDSYRQSLYGGALFRNGLTSTVRTYLRFDRRNNMVAPTKGIYAEASASLTGGFRTGPDQVISLLGGDFNMAEVQGNLRFYQPVIPNSEMLIFRLNSTIGATWSTDGQMIPFIHRYRAGGIMSMRGFYWFSVGPTIRTQRSEDPSQGDDTLVIGGLRQWTNNIELESPIIAAAGIRIVGFMDIGNTFGDAFGKGGIDLGDMRTSAGFGVRWFSPIGPLRFEWGFPLRRREGEQPMVFDFGIGGFF